MNRRDFLNIFALSALLGGAAFWPIALSSARLSRYLSHEKPQTPEGKLAPRPVPRRAAVRVTPNPRSVASPVTQSPARRARPHTGESPAQGEAGRNLLTLATTIAGEHGLDVPVYLALIADESSWRVRAVGRHGERGLMQLKAGTARWCGIRDRFNAEQNLRCGARYLRAQFDTFGSWQMAVVAYKAGPGAVPDNIPAHSWRYAERVMRDAEAMR